MDVFLPEKKMHLKMTPPGLIAQLNRCPQGPLTFITQAYTPEEKDLKKDLTSVELQRDSSTQTCIRDEDVQFHIDGHRPINLPYLERSFQCLECDIILSTAEQLTSHFRTSCRQMYHCIYCPFASPIKFCMSNHILAKHCDHLLTTPDNKVSPEELDELDMEEIACGPVPIIVDPAPFRRHPEDSSMFKSLIAQLMSAGEIRRGSSDIREPLGSSRNSGDLSFEQTDLHGDSIFGQTELDGDTILGQMDLDEDSAEGEGHLIYLCHICGYGSAHPQAMDLHWDECDPKVPPKPPEESPEEPIGNSPKAIFEQSINKSPVSPRICPSSRNFLEAPKQNSKSPVTREPSGNNVLKGNAHPQSHPPSTKSPKRRYKKRQQEISKPSELAQVHETRGIRKAALAHKVIRYPKEIPTPAIKGSGAKTDHKKNGEVTKSKIPGRKSGRPRAVNENLGDAKGNSPTESRRRSNRIAVNNLSQKKRHYRSKGKQNSKSNFGLKEPVKSLFMEAGKKGRLDETVFLEKELLRKNEEEVALENEEEMVLENEEEMSLENEEETLLEHGSKSQLEKSKRLSLENTKKKSVKKEAARTPVNRFKKRTLNKCPYCDVQTTAMALLSHIKLHESSGDGPREFECSRCKIRCTSRINLQLHEKVHLSNSEKDFQCNYCDFASSRRGRTHNHVMGHARWGNLDLDLSRPVHSLYTVKEGYEERRCYDISILEALQDPRKLIQYKIKERGTNLRPKPGKESLPEPGHRRGPFARGDLRERVKMGPEKERKQPAPKSPFADLELTLNQWEEVFYGRTKDTPNENPGVKCKFCGRPFTSKDNLKVHMEDKGAIYCYTFYRKSAQKFLQHSSSPEKLQGNLGGREPNGCFWKKKGRPGEGAQSCKKVPNGEISDDSKAPGGSGTSEGISGRSRMSSERILRKWTVRNGQNLKEMRVSLSRVDAGRERSVLGKSGVSRRTLRLKGNQPVRPTKEMKEELDRIFLVPQDEEEPTVESPPKVLTPSKRKML